MSKQPKKQKKNENVHRTKKKKKSDLLKEAENQISKEKKRDNLKIEKNEEEKSQKDGKNPFLENNHNLTQIEYYEKNITRDGNCYYRCLSYYLRGTEKYHL